MTATPDPNAVEAARLRLAQELLDERPSPKVRAAVMRAAAEAAGHGAVNAVVAPRRPSARRWFEWGPIAAAAGVTMIALLAVGVAIRVERMTSTEAQLPPAQAAKGPRDMPASSLSPPAAAAPRPPAMVAPAPTSDAVREEPSGGMPPATFSRVAPASPATNARSFAPARPSLSEQAKKPEASAAPQPMMQAPAMGTAAPQAVPPLPAAAEVRSSNAGQTARMKAAKEPMQPSMAPDDWLRRIIELRRAARNAEADEELGRFRAAYPNASIPPEALK